MSVYSIILIPNPNMECDFLRCQLRSVGHFHPLNLRQPSWCIQFCLSTCCLGLKNKLPLLIFLTICTYIISWVTCQAPKPTAHAPHVVKHSYKLFLHYDLSHGNHCAMSRLVETNALVLFESRPYTSKFENDSITVWGLNVYGSTCMCCIHKMKCVVSMFQVLYQSC